MSSKRKRRLQSKYQKKLLSNMSEKDYMTKQKEKMERFKAGTTDLNGNNIIKIHGRGDEYIVYEIETNDLVDSVKIYIDNVTEGDDSGIIKRYNNIRVSFVDVKGYLHKVIDKASVKSRIAQILIHAINSDKVEKAEELFQKLKNEIDENYKEQFKNRLKYVLSSLVVVLSFIFFSFLNFWFKYFDEYQVLNELVFTCTAGSIGSFLSISIGLSKIFTEINVLKWWYIFYGAIRTIIGIFASIILYFAMKSNIIFGDINLIDNYIFSFIFLSFVAGFSETLIPNLLSKFNETGKKG